MTNPKKAPVSAPKIAKKSGEPGWKWRRAIIFPVVGYACWQLHLLVGAQDTRVNETIAYGWMLLICVLILGYTGFATIQDIAAIWKTGTGLPYATPPVAIDGDPAPPPDDQNEPPPGYAG